MYTRYFGLTEKPFAIAPNPKYLFMSELHREALAHLLYGVNAEGCIILLTGDVGTGKTTVCRCLIQQLPETTDVALILNPRMTIDDLLKTICEELKIEIDEESPSIKAYVDGLNQYLLQAHSKGRITAVIIDEAQNLDVDVLEQLRLLTNLETDTRKLLQIVLIGQPELQGILNNPHLQQISQRITTRYHLEPLRQGDVEIYVQHRMVIAGLPEHVSIFSKDALKFVAKKTKGIPRLINIICDRAMLGAYAENKDHISLAVMKKAAREVIESDNSSESRRRSFAYFAMVALVVLALGLYLGKYGADITPLMKIYNSLNVEENVPQKIPETLPESSGELSLQPGDSLSGIELIEV